MTSHLQKIIERSKRDHESWRYTPLENLLASSKRTASNSNAVPHYSDDNGSRLIFVNGIWQPKKSHFGSVPSCILMGDSENGYTLTLGEHTCLVAQPIELVFVSDEKNLQESHVKLSIEVGANGRLTLLERHVPSAAVAIVETSIELHERAKFVHGKIITGGAYIGSTTVRVSKGAYYNNFVLIRGGTPVRNEIEATLIGEEAQATLNGAMLLSRSEHADTTTCITHSAPHCTSRQIYKTVLDEKSHGVFQGKIYVAEGAQKTDGYQLSRALLLSDQAEMDAKPELEIYADDVKCSHGSAIGDLDADALFYLRSRGLSEIEARQLLIGAFVGELFDEIPIEGWRALFHAEMEGWRS